LDELDIILDRWRLSRHESCAAILATVVDISGSAYRRPGARMLIFPSGERVGSLSGGCLENEIAKKAWWYTDSGAATVRTFDMTADDEATWGFGLGCNGIVHVILEWTESQETQGMLEFLSMQRLLERPGVVATVIRIGDGATPYKVKVGDRLLLNDGCIAGGCLVGSVLETKIARHAASAAALRRSHVASIDAVEVLVEYIDTPTRLFVFGGGYDAVPLVQTAALLGWKTTVADSRTGHAKSERFPGADCVLFDSRQEPLRDLPITSDAAVVLMTHSYSMDRLLLPAILLRKPRYIGMLGPAARARSMFTELDIHPPPTFHSPIGLDIGCDCPATIAISIVAEIQAVMSGRSGTMLRFREGTIHAPVAKLNEQTLDSTPGLTHFIHSEAGLDGQR
jgi:xanthine dehydrogenase accessory factor